MSVIKNVKSIFWLSEYEEMNVPASAEFYAENGKVLKKIEGIETLTVESNIKRIKLNPDFGDIEFEQPVDCQITKIPKKEMKEIIPPHNYKIICR